jgi:hypothetical protein
MAVDGDGYNPDAYLRRPAPEKTAMLPGLNDPNKAAGFVDNEVSRLVLIMGKDGFRIGRMAYVFLQYVHIGLGELGFTADGQVFRFIFSDLQPKLVTVRGRNLQRICDYVSLRRMQWIRQADRDFRPADQAADDEPIITRIDIEDWKPEESQSGTAGQTADGRRA